MNFAKIKQMSNLKKFLLFGGIVVVALALALYVQKPEEITTPAPVQPRGEAQIVVYGKGEKVVLNPNLFHFKDLQIACEELLGVRPPAPHEVIFKTTPTILGRAIKDNSTFSSLKELKSKEWAIELVYEKNQEVYLKEEDGAIRKTPYSFTNFLIPLTGKLVKNRFIFICEEENLSSCFTAKTTKDIQKIKEILRNFGIEIK